MFSYKHVGKKNWYTGEYENFLWESSLSVRRSWRPCWSVSHRKVISIIKMLKRFTAGWNVLIHIFSEWNICLCLSSIFRLKEKRKISGEEGRIVPLASSLWSKTPFFSFVFIIWNNFFYLKFILLLLHKLKVIMKIKWLVSAINWLLVAFTCHVSANCSSGFRQTKGAVRTWTDVKENSWSI